MAKRKRVGGEACSAIGCSNARYRYDCAGMSFFRFPKDEERSRMWVQKSGREDLLRKTAQELHTGGYTFCSKHFEPRQFLNQDYRNRLVWNAVPTLFDIPNGPTRKLRTRPSRKKGSAALPHTQEKGKKRRILSNTGAPSYLRDIRSPDWIPTVNLGDDPGDGVKGKRKGRRRQEGNAAAAPAETKVLAAKASSTKVEADVSLDGGDVAAADTDSAREQLLATATMLHTGDLAGTLSLMEGLCHQAALTSEEENMVEALGVAGACAVFGCPNSSEQLQRWWREPCLLHRDKVGQDGCHCQPPFALRRFPTNNQSLRDVWISQIRQALPEEDKMWEPDEQSRVCSIHFAQGVAYPTLYLGAKTEPTLVACRLQQSASGGGAPEEKRRRVEVGSLALSDDEGEDVSSPWNSATALADSGTSASPSCGPAARGASHPPTLDIADLSSLRTCSSSAPTLGHAPPSRSPCRDCLAKDKVIQHMQSEIWALQEEVEAIKEKLKKSRCGSVIGYKAV